MWLAKIGYPHLVFTNHPANQQLAGLGQFSQRTGYFSGKPIMVQVGQAACAESNYHLVFLFRTGIKLILMSQHKIRGNRHQLILKNGGGAGMKDFFVEGHVFFQYCLDRCQQGVFYAGIRWDLGNQCTANGREGLMNQLVNNIGNG